MGYYDWNDWGDCHIQERSRAEAEELRQCTFCGDGWMHDWRQDEEYRVHEEERDLFLRMEHAPISVILREQPWLSDSAVCKCNQCDECLEVLEF